MTAHPVFVISGAAGTGKTTLAQAFARQGNAQVVDLDVVAAAVVQAAQAKNPDASEWQINATVRQERYAALSEAVRQLRANSAVIAVAPFTEEISDADRWKDLVASLGGEPVHLVWLDLDPALRAQRIAGRGATRDHGRIEVDRRAPAVGYLHLDAAGSVEDLVRGLMSRFGNEAF